MTCPGFERLIDHLDGRLEAAAAETVAAHLASGCEECASDRTWYESVRRTTAADDSIEPPPWVLKRAIKVFDGVRNRSGLTRRLGDIIATLVFDSFEGPAFAGARATEAAEHQLLYRADGFNIDLLVEPSEQQMNLRGQILREGESTFESTSGISLELVREGQLIHSTCTNHVGEFTIPAIELGRYDLRIEASEVSITVTGLAIV
jgi:hypothetical protein